MDRIIIEHDGDYLVNPGLGEDVRIWNGLVPEAVGSVAVPPAEVQLNLFEEPHPELFEGNTQ